MSGQLIADLTIAAPEAATALAAMLLLMLGAFAGERSAMAVNTIATVLLIGLAGLVMWVAPAGGEAFAGGFVLDPLARYAKVVIALCAAATLIMSAGFLSSERLARFEYPVLVMLAVLGMMMMVSARDLITLYMGVELQSLALYVLAAFNRDSLRASEAGLKYFVLGALSSGLLLYGASLIYGFAGSTRFDEIAASISGEPSIGLLFGVVFLICGLAFKVSAAPFHMWTPDVYEGAPTPVTGFFAAAPKLAAMVLFARVLLEPFPEIAPQWRQVLVAIAILSLLVGSYGALVQSNIKRLMAYSSIANMGFALTPLCAGTARGVEGMLTFMTIYVISVIGVFACILTMRRREGMVERIEDLKGLSRTHPGLALALTALLFSIAGVPPLVGFFGKLFAFMPAWEAGLWYLVLVGVLASVVSAFYYLRLVRLMWFDQPAQPFVSAPRELATMTVGAAALTFPILLLPMVVSPGREAIARAAGALF
ncbi:MAG: NADH-quinone oxidoreductase subunit NuoN [Caulobacterales bacterium]|nr:NADH-quinone oxidoreductase subunit NuoN [Caulobacterales bacterium]